jgi:hypothetical protein
MNKRFKSYPLRIAAIGLATSFAMYALGAYIMAGFGLTAAVIYLAYCAFMELAILRKSCRHCFYYGRVCAFGRGAACSLLYRRGDPQRFIDRTVTFRDLIPDMLVSLIPFIGGIALLIMDFRWGMLLALAMIVLLATVGNALVRGRIACRHCAQRELGCPAERLFNTQRAGSPEAGRDFA